jgi:hypothetical protein
MFGFRTNRYCASRLFLIGAVAGELLSRRFLLRIPTQCNNVTLGENG